MSTNALSAPLFLLALATSFFVIKEPAPTDILFILALVAALVGARVHIPPAIYSFCILSFIFLVANTSSAMACTHFGFCMRYMLITIYLFLVPLLMMHLVVEFGETFLAKMYKAFFFAIMVSAVVGIMARSGFTPGPTSLYFRSDSGLRLSPFFKDPNVYAPFLALGITLLLGHVLAGTIHFWRGLAAVTLAWIPMFLAFSRAAWFALAVTVLVFVLLMAFLGFRNHVGRKFWGMVLTGIFVILPISLAVLLMTDLLDFFGHRLGLQSYDSNRFGAHREAIAVAIQNPFGIGPGHFVGRRNFPDSQFSLGSHNVYWKVWVENGFIGLISFMLIFVTVLRGLLKAALERTPRFPIHAALFAGLCGILANSYFIDTLHWRHLFFALGFAYAELWVLDQSRARAASAGMSVNSRAAAPALRGAPVTSRSSGVVGTG